MRDTRLQTYAHLLRTVTEEDQVQPYVKNVLEVVGGNLAWFVEQVNQSDSPFKRQIIELLRPKLRL